MARRIGRKQNVQRAIGNSIASIERSIEATENRWSVRPSEGPSIHPMEQTARGSDVT